MDIRVKMPRSLLSSRNSPPAKMQNESLIECVANFSEGRDAGVVGAIVPAILDGPEVWLLHKTMDADHHRSVVTFAGTVSRVGEAALRGIGQAAALIDLNYHRGVHPRIGAADVIPFVPLAGSRMEDCVHIARWVAEEAARRFAIPTYLYEAAASRPERRNLESVRRGQFEVLKEKIRTDPSRLPDFGAPELHPTAGATSVGARGPLIAFNINLNTHDASIAQVIARKIRASSGGLPCVKAIGLYLPSRDLAQVSMNLTDFAATPLSSVFRAVRDEARATGVTILESEIVGLVPRAALESVDIEELKINNFSTSLILENRLAEVLAGQPG
jgi:glutamate formiminotransferase